MSVRAPVGNVNINPFKEICIGRGLAIIRTGNIKTTNYLLYYIAHNTKLFQGNRGAIFDAISTKDLKEIKIPLPSLPVQKEIVSQIEVFEEEIKQAEKIISDSQNQKSNILDKYLK